MMEDMGSFRAESESLASVDSHMLGNGFDIHEFTRLAYMAMVGTEKLNLRDPDVHSVPGVLCCGSLE